MSTLAKISETLQDQNKVLIDQGQTLDKSAASMEKLNKNFSRFLTNLASEETDSLETEAEARAKVTKSKSVSGGSRLAGAKDKATNFLTGLGIPGMGALLGQGLLGGLIRGGLAYVMAEQVAEYIRSQGFSEEIADAVGRGLTGYGILRVFGKRLGMIGLLGGALATEDNINTTKDHLETLSKSFEEGWTKLGDWFDKTFGVEGLIPTTDEIIKKINNIVGDSLTGLNAFLRGDWNSKEFYENLDDMAITFGALALMLKPGGTLRVLTKSIGKLGAAALALSGLNSAVSGLVPPTTTAGVTTAKKANLNAGTLQQQAGKLSAKQLAAEGLSKNSAGRIIDTSTGKFASTERLNSAVTNAATSGKFPRISKFLRLPGIAYLFGMYDIYSILSSPGSMESKIAPLAGVLSAVLGSGGGAMLGAALGSIFPGPGTIVGGALGGIAGWLGGETVGKGLAQFLLGQKVDSFGYGFGWVNDMLNGVGSPSNAAPSPSMMSPDDMMNDAVSSTVSRGGSTVGQQLQSAAQGGMSGYAGAYSPYGIGGGGNAYSFGGDTNIMNSQPLVTGDVTASQGNLFGNNRK